MRCTLKVVHLSGAQQLFEQALREDGDHLVIDFTASEVEDRALSALAELLAQAHLRLGGRGLRQPQTPLLEYLGAVRPATR